MYLRVSEIVLKNKYKKKFEQNENMINWRSPAFQTWTWMFESEFESEQVFWNFQSLILTSFFCNFWKVRKRTNSEYSVNLECSETPVFDPKPPVFTSKTGFFDPNLFPFLENFCELKKMDISKKNPNFGNRTIPKLSNSETTF